MTARLPQTGGSTATHRPHSSAYGDYSLWFREIIKDRDLAAAAEDVERAPDMPAAASRAAMRAEIEKHYTVPA
jgi:hypothetical protein